MIRIGFGGVHLPDDVVVHARSAEDGLEPGNDLRWGDEPIECPGDFRVPERLRESILGSRINLVERGVRDPPGGDRAVSEEGHTEVLRKSPRSKLIRTPLVLRGLVVDERPQSVAPADLPPSGGPRIRPCSVRGDGSVVIQAQRYVRGIRGGVIHPDGLGDPDAGAAIDPRCPVVHALGHAAVMADPDLVRVRRVGHDVFQVRVGRRETNDGRGRTISVASTVDSFGEEDLIRIERVDSEGMPPSHVDRGRVGQTTPIRQGVGEAIRACIAHIWQVAKRACVIIKNGKSAVRRSAFH